jgi:hypothetical protein
MSDLKPVKKLSIQWDSSDNKTGVVTHHEKTTVIYESYIYKGHWADSVDDIEESHIVDVSNPTIHSQYVQQPKQPMQPLQHPIIPPKVPVSYAQSVSYSVEAKKGNDSYKAQTQMSSSYSSGSYRGGKQQARIGEQASRIQDQPQRGRGGYRGGRGHIQKEYQSRDQVFDNHQRGGYRTHDRKLFNDRNDYKQKGPRVYNDNYRDNARDNYRDNGGVKKTSVSYTVERHTTIRKEESIASVEDEDDPIIPNSNIKEHWNMVARDENPYGIRKNTVILPYENPTAPPEERNKIPDEYNYKLFCKLSDNNLQRNAGNLPFLRDIQNKIYNIHDQERERRNKERRLNGQDELINEEIPFVRAIITLPFNVQFQERPKKMTITSPWIPSYAYTKFQKNGEIEYTSSRLCPYGIFCSRALVDKSDNKKSCKDYHPLRAENGGIRFLISKNDDEIIALFELFISIVVDKSVVEAGCYHTYMVILFEYVRIKFLEAYSKINIPINSPYVDILLNGVGPNETLYDLLLNATNGKDALGKDNLPIKIRNETPEALVRSQGKGASLDSDSDSEDELPRSTWGYIRLFTIGTGKEMSSIYVHEPSDSSIFFDKELFRKEYEEKYGYPYESSDDECDLDYDTNDEKNQGLPQLLGNYDSLDRSGDEGGPWRYVDIIPREEENFASQKGKKNPEEPKLTIKYSADYEGPERYHKLTYELDHILECVKIIQNNASCPMQRIICSIILIRYLYIACGYAIEG